MLVNRPLPKQSIRWLIPPARKIGSYLYFRGHKRVIAERADCAFKRKRDPAGWGAELHLRGGIYGRYSANLLFQSSRT